MQWKSFCEEQHIRDLTGLKQLVADVESSLEDLRQTCRRLQGSQTVHAISARPGSAAAHTTSMYPVSLLIPNGFAGAAAQSVRPHPV